MAMITVLLDRTTGVLTELDEAQLQRYDSVYEDDEIRLDLIEYCLVGCEGDAHKTGVAQGDGCFCEKHVHRSASGQVKRWPVEASGVAQSLV